MNSIDNPWFINAVVSVSMTVEIAPAAPTSFASFASRRNNVNASSIIIIGVPMFRIPSCPSDAHPSIVSSVDNPPRNPSTNPIIAAGTNATHTHTVMIALVLASLMFVFSNIVLFFSVNCR